ncbi:EH signature domain-containing protein [Tatumella sp. JGM118]|uniref:EH signature domain-containing protein n=1 Tax=Tatumella terrea TaxID=419007 RepID=A0ABW1W1B3_9GAMM|nr:EH signature domain-containing protein [Tatumella sp. JGM118]MBS0907937.1 hypothetical protein [Tatumella sp. JGM118]
MSLALSELLLHPKKISAKAVVESSALKQSIRQVHLRWPDIDISSNDKDQQSVLQEILGYVVHWEWRNVSMSLVCEGARYLFSDRFVRLPLFEPLRQFYLKELESNRSTIFLSTMFKAYLESYQPGSEHTLALLRGLQQQQSYLPGRWQMLIGNIPEILEANHAHRLIADRMVPMLRPYQELSSQGLSSRSGTGLMSLVFRAYIDKIADKLTEPQWIEALFEWLKPEGKERLETGAEYALNALLSHWYYQQPDEHFATQLTEKLTALYGDPRTRTGGVWGRVDDKTRQVIIRWLTREDMSFFMDVVSSVESSHMWAPRRKFWMDLYKQGKINAAWVAFSSEAYSRAKEIKSAGGAISELNFGEQSATHSSRKNTSLLIMQIGHCTVVEGSHNYKVHFFKETAKNGPQLFLSQYDCEDIRCSADIYDAITHTPNSWQGKVLEILDYIA